MKNKERKRYLKFYTNSRQCKIYYTQWGKLELSVLRPKIRLLEKKIIIINIDAQYMKKTFL